MTVVFGGMFVHRGVHKEKHDQTSKYGQCFSFGMKFPLLKRHFIIYLGLLTDSMIEHIFIGSLHQYSLMIRTLSYFFGLGITV